MSDIGINLDGLVSFLAAAGLGLLLIAVMLIGSLIGLVRAHQKQERFNKQRFFPHLLGMAVSLLGCLGIELLLLLTDSNLPPRNIPVWLDRWVLLWLPALLVLWPITVQLWLRRTARMPARISSH